MQSAVLLRQIVHLSVSPYRGHTGWNTSKVISRLVSPGCSLFADPNILLQREHPEILAGMGVQYGKNLSAYISETGQNSGGCYGGYYALPSRHRTESALQKSKKTVNQSLKHKVNRCVLSLRLNECKLSASRTAAGRLFYTTGPATEKALSPN